MTQTDSAVTTPATALAVYLSGQLESAGAPLKLNVYRGVQTPLELDAAEAETAALAHGAAVHDLGWQKRIAVRGEDRFRWLSGMVTNTVNDLATHTGAWNLVLNAQGRIQGDLTVWRENDDLELEIAADQTERLLAHLERFIIMDDVELVSLNGEAAGEAGAETAIGLTGPLADEVLARLSLPALPEPMSTTRVEFNGMQLQVVRGYGTLAQHYEFWVAETLVWKLWKFLRAAGATAVGSARLESFRIADGIPLYGADIAERDLPQETSQTRALHFSKGCYLGQEIVERIRSRGNVHRHLRQLELTGPIAASGTELKTEDGKPVGQITSAAELTLDGTKRVFALGMIRAEAEVHKGTLSFTDGAAAGTARLLDGPSLG